MLSLTTCVTPHGDGLHDSTHGIYFVLGSSDVKQVGHRNTPNERFCVDFCGWHSFDPLFFGGRDIKFSFVGDPSVQCPEGCEPQTEVSPNGNPGVDAMVSVVAHELAETVTDPDEDAWIDAEDNEIADKCLDMFGVEHTLENGAKYNIEVKERLYLIQELWVHSRFDQLCHV